MSKNYVPFNINQTIKVKLTPLGERVLIEQDLKLRKEYPNFSSSFVLPKQDDDGYYTFQMWDFMEKLGSYMGAGSKLVIDCNIFIETVDKQEAKEPKLTPEMLKLIKDSLYMNLEYQKKFLENHKHKEMANHYMHQHIEDLKEVIKILEGKE